MRSNLCRAALMMVFGALALGGCNSLPAASLQQTAAWQGTYAGQAVIGDPNIPAQVCSPQIPMRGFTVSGNQVQFGEFSGTIANNGSVEMVFRQMWIRGGFVPDAFIGELLTAPGGACTYRITLSRI